MHGEAGCVQGEGLGRRAVCRGRGWGGRLCAGKGAGEVDCVQGKGLRRWAVGRGKGCVQGEGLR